jgi:hypothetical protein
MEKLTLHCELSQASLLQSRQAVCTSHLSEANAITEIDVLSCMVQNLLASRLMSNNITIRI